MRFEQHAGFYDRSGKSGVDSMSTQNMSIPYLGFKLLWTIHVARSTALIIYTCIALDMAPSFSTDRTAELKEAFSLFDRDGDGKLAYLRLFI